MILPWVALRPSLREQRWRRAGSAVAAITVLVLAAAAVMSEFDAVLLLLATGAAMIAWMAVRPAATRPVEIGIDDEGAVVLRGSNANASDHVRLQCSFAAPWLITLRHGTMLVSVWPDSLPEAVYRRLWVHLRWTAAADTEGRRADANDVERR